MILICISISIKLTLPQRQCYFNPINITLHDDDDDDDDYTMMTNVMNWNSLWSLFSLSQKLTLLPNQTPFSLVITRTRLFSNFQQIIFLIKILLKFLIKFLIKFQ
jgi:hypothetical protein